MHMQYVVDRMTVDIKPNVEAWLDDVTPHAATEREYLAPLEALFLAVRQNRLKLQAKKTVLVGSSITFCGRIVTEDRVQFWPQSLSALQDMPPPINAYQLQQYFWCDRLDEVAYSAVR